jgi:hypothetical protein
VKLLGHFAVEDGRREGLNREGSTWTFYVLTYILYQGWKKNPPGFTHKSRPEYIISGTLGTKSIVKKQENMHKHLLRILVLMTGCRLDLTQKNTCVCSILCVVKPNAISGCTMLAVR